MSQSGALEGGDRWFVETAKALVAPLGDRWLHLQSVGERAEQVCGAVSDPGVLVAAAWLHDIGYAPDIAKTGFHPVDGARFLRAGGVDERIVALVAHHSCAYVEADRRRMTDALADFERPHGVLPDALTFCDMTTGPRGQAFTFEERIEEILTRYPPGSVVHESIASATDELRGMVERTEALLLACGATDQSMCG